MPAALGVDAVDIHVHYILQPKDQGRTVSAWPRKGEFE